MSTARPRPARREHRGGTSYVVVTTRTFRAPIADVWAAVTEPARLERWIGTWTGDPTSGSVDFRMTAEAGGRAGETHRIDACEPPRRLVHAVTRAPATTPSGASSSTWPRPTASRRSPSPGEDDPEIAENVGPGWDYYLDRLVAAETGPRRRRGGLGRLLPGAGGHYRRRSPDHAADESQ